MSREYSFTLTVPLEDIEAAEALLAQVKTDYIGVRITRKTDRAGAARFYLSFPFLDARPDLKFQQWFGQASGTAGWDLFGPTHGRWGFV